MADAIVKLSDEESEFLTGIGDPKAVCRMLWHDELKLLAVTRGRASRVYFTQNSSYCKFSCDPSCGSGKRMTRPSTGSTT
jgi:sugar/nucleoside kinase (ribokinase family)